LSEYTFTTLAPNEFEDLSKDLLEVHLSVPLQGFTTGRDGGVDLRHAPTKGRDWVVQCKHYPAARFSTLKSSLKKELPKLEKLKPQRYVLATSCGLTPDNVDILFDMLAPYCLSKHDILGKTQLNAILRNNAQVERNHPKLWINSEAVLSRVLHNEVFVQSEIDKEGILRRFSLFVHSNRYDNARRTLDKDKVCLITGVPGVGKTTLAEMLILEHLADDWELVVVRQNISEALQILKDHPKSKQVFYYDDFLGQISLGMKLGKNEDIALVQLIDSVRNKSNKRLILTTREYILAQAKREFGHLGRSDIDLLRLVVECRDYSDEARARILANHLYFYEVPKRHIAAVAKNQGYQKIIDHPNYNPRLVESMTRRLDTKKHRASVYLAAFLNRLDQPKEVWHDAFSEKISEAGRHLLLTLVATGSAARSKQLERDFGEFYRHRCKEYGWGRRPTDYENALNELEGTFVRIRAANDDYLVEWHNPSVLDFLDDWLRAHPQDVEDLVTTASRFEQIDNLITKTPVLKDVDENLAANIDPSKLTSAFAKLSSNGRPTWRELQSLMQLCESDSDDSIQTEVRRFLQEAFVSLETESPDALEIIGVLDLVQDQEWLSSDDKSVWADSFKRHVLATEDECVDQSDHWVIVAKWVKEFRLAFSSTEYAEFLRNLDRSLVAMTEADWSPNTKDLWESMKDDVEELQSILCHSFDRVMERIEDNIDNADDEEDEPVDVAKKILKPTQVNSIDSIFDALLN